VSTEEFVAVLDFLPRGLGWAGGLVKERVRAAWGLFGNEFTVFMKGMCVEFFICC